VPWTLSGVFCLPRETSEGGNAPTTSASPRVFPANYDSAGKGSKGSLVHNPTITFVVHGTCEPAGSKKAYIPRGSKGTPVIVDANPKAAPWKVQIARTCALVYRGPLLDGPLAIVLRFYRPRGNGHYRTGRHAGLLRDSAPPRPATRPDVDKNARAVLDGLEGQLYRNDAQIVDMHASKHYGEPARVEIEVTPLDDRHSSTLELPELGGKDPSLRATPNVSF
jgi:Holliday junction resolvase RusA-like endonuclease